jgi:hypothetical protein
MWLQTTICSTRIFKQGKLRSNLFSALDSHKSADVKAENSPNMAKYSASLGEHGTR